MGGRGGGAGEEIRRERKVEPDLREIFGGPFELISIFSVLPIAPIFSSSDPSSRTEIFFPFFPKDNRSSTGESIERVRIRLPLNDVVRSRDGETGGRVGMAW